MAWGDSRLFFENVMSNFKRIKGFISVIGLLIFAMVIGVILLVCFFIHDLKQESSI